MLIFSVSFIAFLAELVFWVQIPNIERWFIATIVVMVVSVSFGISGIYSYEED